MVALTRTPALDEEAMSEEPAPFSLDPLQLTADLVSIDSHNPGPGEAAIAEFVIEHVARPMGVEVTRFEPAPGRPNLLLTVDRGAGAHLVLSGHLDTKPTGDADQLWDTDPLRLVVRDGLAYGLGASDMKGPIAAMLTALGRFAIGTGTGKASVLLTADEEVASVAGAAALAAAGQPRCDALVIGEPSGASHPWEMIAVVSRGICCVEIELNTPQGHSGLSEHRHPNAVVVAAGVIRAFHGFEPPIAEPGPIPCLPTVNAESPSQAASASEPRLADASLAAKSGWCPAWTKARSGRRLGRSCTRLSPGAPRSPFGTSVTAADGRLPPPSIPTSRS